MGNVFLFGSENTLMWIVYLWIDILKLKIMKHPPALDVYDLYNRFLDEFIMNGRSILTKDKIECLNQTTLDNCQRVYVVGADFSSDKSFGNKLKNQLENEDYPTRLVMAHVEWLWALGTIDLKIETKRALTERTLGSMVVSVELEDSYVKGFGSCGTFHQRSKYKEVEFILLLVQYLYKARLKGEFKVYEDVAHLIECVCLVKKYGSNPADYGLEKGVTSNGGQAMINILLHLSNPECYERIASNEHKQKIVSAFYHLLNDEDKQPDKRINLIDNQEANLDDKIYQIRQKLEIELGNPNFDFYDEDIKVRWDKSGDKSVPLPPAVPNIELTKNEKIDMPTFPLNQILYGPPGTGKTYHTINKALAIIENKTEEELEIEDRKALKKRFDDYVTEGSIVFTTFHQSMSYEDFIEGIKPIEPEESDAFLQYEIVSGIFKQICMYAQTPNISDFERVYSQLLEELNNLEGQPLELVTPNNKKFSITANSRGNLNLITGIKNRKSGALTKIGIQKELNGEKYYNWWKGYYEGVMKYLDKKYQFKPEINSNNSKNYVLIIDEINRGNVSQIFGELITLIEEDKRLGKDEALTVTLPYSKEKFGVPSNVYIIGTMNTADRSVEALDTALRRRFSFVEMPPQYDLAELDREIVGFKLYHILQTINDRIEVLLNKDNLIGHSYFLKVDSPETLKETMFKNIIPLLQEYFFGDYGKIGLVLGEGFVKIKREESNKRVSFAKFDYDTEGVHKRVYELISEKDVDIKKAIESLLA